MKYPNTHDLDDHFFFRVEEVADDLLARPRDMLAVMMSESGISATAWNDNPKSLPPEKRWNASGLIQFMPATLTGLGWPAGHAAFRRLSATEQLTWVERYYRPYRGYLSSIGALYTATFLPALLKHASDPSFVLTAKAGPLGWAYAPNASFDANHDYAITVGELEDAVCRNCHGPRWAEVLRRLGASDVGPETDADGPDLGTVRGLQLGLSRLGFDVGDVDGIAGPKTSNAVLMFQADRGLTIDGIYGPRTRAALSIALATAA